MWRRALVFTLFLSGAQGLQAQEKALVPQGPPPQVGLASANPAVEGAQLRLVVPEPRYETRTRIVEKGGEKYEEKYVVTVFVPRERIVMVYDAKKAPFADVFAGAQVLDLKGKKVDHRKLPELLKKATPVLVSTSGAFDPYYMQVVKEGTLFVILPRKFYARKAEGGAGAGRPRD